MINRPTTHLSKHLLKKLGNRSVPKTKLFIQKQSYDEPVQKPYLCYPKVLELIEPNKFCKLKESPYYTYHEIVSKPAKNFIPCFIKEKAFTTTDLSEMMGHKILTRFEVTFNQLDSYFKTSSSPALYCLLRWGDDNDKMGYKWHCILVKNVLEKESVPYISYLDVSDKLPSIYSRIREMSIEEFNQRREIFSLNKTLGINYFSFALKHKFLTQLPVLLMPL